MCRKMIYLTFIALVLVLAGNASAELVAYWPFDEGSGTTLNDIIGGNNGSCRQVLHYLTG